MNVKVQRGHYHVVTFINGCLTDYDSGPLATKKEARQELARILREDREMGRRVVKMADGIYASGLYLNAREECTEPLEYCESAAY